MSYAIYLRKSRADLELEAKGELETLAKHERQLKELASKLNLNVVKEYKEVVSGETISARPQMQELLRAVQDNLYDGVIVMEIERLARGDTIDQGIVAQTFKYSNTKIITPTKTYDPNNEFDEEYFEFDFRRAVEQGFDFKDAIINTRLDFSEETYFKTDDKYCSHYTTMLLY